MAETAPAPRIESTPVAAESTASLVRRLEPANPWITKVEQKGVNLTIHPAFTNPDRYPVGTHLDPKTGLPMEEDEMRVEIANQFSRCIREGRKWVMIYADVDNLKKGNSDHGREFGDTVIMYGAAAVTNEIVKALDPNLVDDQKKIYASRQANAADETVVIIFDPTDDEIAKVKGAYGRMEAPFKTTDPDFTFSLSANLITSDDPEIQPLLADAKQYLDKDPEAIAFDTYNTLKDRADYAVKVRKIEKDLQRIPEEKIMTVEGLDEFEDVIAEDLGDSRWSKALVKMVLRLHRIFVVMEMAKGAANDESFNDLLRKSNIDRTKLIEACDTNTRKEFIVKTLQNNQLKPAA